MKRVGWNHLHRASERRFVSSISRIHRTTRRCGWFPDIPSCCLLADFFFGGGWGLFCRKFGENLSLETRFKEASIQFFNGIPR